MLAVLAAATWLLVRPHSRGARRYLLIVALFYLLVSVYSVPYAVGRALAYRYQPLTAAAVTPSRTAIVILGGGGGAVRAGGRQIGVISAGSASRVLEAHRVSTLVEFDWIVSSGGLTDPRTSLEANATLMRDALVKLGVPESKILVESESGNTRGHAVSLAPLLRRLAIEQVVLVTTDIHMPRALATFRAQGWHCVPAIVTDPRKPNRLLQWLMPTGHGLDYSGQVAHELLGNTYYAARGWR